MILALLALNRLFRLQLQLQTRSYLLMVHQMQLSLQRHMLNRLLRRQQKLTDSPEGLSKNLGAHLFWLPIAAAVL